MPTRRSRTTSLAPLALAGLLLAGPGEALTILPASQIGIDIGPTTTDVFENDWNDFTAAGADSTIHTLDGTVKPGVSVSVTGGIYTNDGLDNWIGLASEGGAAPEAFIDSVTTDLAFLAVTVTVNGLDPNETYDFYAVTHGFSDSFDSRRDTVTVTGASAASSSLFRGQSRSQGLYHTFLDVAPNAGGTVTIRTSGASFQPVLNGVLIDRVPEPGTVALLGVGGLMVARRRRG